MPYEEDKLLQIQWVDEELYNDLKKVSDIIKEKIEKVKEKNDHDSYFRLIDSLIEIEKLMQKCMGF